MEKDLMLFEAHGARTGETKWNYKLSISPNSTFKLDFKLRNYIKDTQDDWIYEGSYNLSFQFGSYILTFSNIIKTGESRA